VRLLGGHLGGGPEKGREVLSPLPGSIESVPENHSCSVLKVTPGCILCGESKIGKGTLGVLIYFFADDNITSTDEDDSATRDKTLSLSFIHSFIHSLPIFTFMSVVSSG
jgi:hypothetical protein